MNKWRYSKDEIQLFKKLNTPKKIQDFINKIPFNFEKDGETCMSPRMVLKNNKAHCVEGAMLASAILEFHGYKPLLLDLKTTSKPYDFDHVVSVFKQFGCFGAISKTNHSVLRYREPIYKNIRELVMSYFHEYFLEDGTKTLREYSNPFDLNYFNKLNWRITNEDLFTIPAHLDDIKHYKILSPAQIKNLRKADPIEIQVTNFEEYKKK